LKNQILLAFLLIIIASCTPESKKHFERNLLDSYFISSDHRPLQIIEWKMTVTEHGGDSANLKYLPDTLTSENYEFEFDDDRALTEIIQFNNRFFAAGKTTIQYESLNAIERINSDSFEISFEAEGNLVRKIKKNKSVVIAIDELIYNSTLDTLKEIKSFDQYERLVKHEIITYKQGRRTGYFVQFEPDDSTLQGTRMFDEHGNCTELKIFKNNKPYLWIWRQSYYRDIDRITLDHDGIGALPGLIW
jgi:hypothetical protein